MSVALLDFHAELNDFLARDRRNNTFAHAFNDRVSVKDMIESLGVPHTEVDAIVVNGQPVDFSYIVQDGDRVDIYPPSIVTDVVALPLPCSVATCSRKVIFSPLPCARVMRRRASPAMP